MQRVALEVSRHLTFQTFFSPSSLFQDIRRVFLFVQDHQDVDDIFDLAWFWAKDPQGLERLSQTEVLALGLYEPRPSKICLGLWNLTPSAWKDLRIFHEIFGFAVDSPDIPISLDLPVASVEWDGMQLSLIWCFCDNSTKNLQKRRR
jgi:hypothetical protein